MMDKPLTVKHNFTGDFCVPCIQSRQEEVHQWLLGHEKKETPFYSSVDIRDAGFKMTVVDTNLFPAGFNNLCEHGLADASHFIREAILKRVPGAHKILIVTEEHTRNTGYLENVSILQDIIRKAGFEVNVAFPEDIKTACTPCDLIVMNNDLSGGIPDALKKSNIPVFPSMHAGWHARLKSGHFAQTGRLAEEFARIVGLDPWLFSCLFEAVDDVDVNSDDGHQKLHDAAVRLFDGVRAKYKEHHINEKPFVFIKADSGTYGMGVVPIEDPSMVLELNRKKRNDLLRGKSGQLVTRFLLQEGVPTIQRIEESPCEVCIYQIDNNLIGGFYRYHTGKGSRENLNSPGGMAFQKVCPHLGKYGQDCGVKHNMNIFDIYRILARIAGVAAGRETRELESQAR